MIVLPTPGHLAGDVSMLVRRTEGPPLLLIGDLSYSKDRLQRDQLPWNGDHKLLLESFAKVKALEKHTPDLVIVAAHDTTAKAKLATTTELVAAPDDHRGLARVQVRWSIAAWPIES